jgi:hypothetical protein
LQEIPLALGWLPAVKPALVPCMKVGPLSTPPGQQYWFVTCWFGAAPVSKSIVTGAAWAGEAPATMSSAAAAAVTAATVLADRAMLGR